MSRLTASDTGSAPSDAARPGRSHLPSAAHAQRTARRAAHAPVARTILIGAALSLAAACVPSTQEEVALGTQYAAQINRELPIVRDPEVQRYITVLGDSIARVADTRNLDWHFYVVDSDEVNAFAVPGGFIYVNRGLIQRAATLSELAGVIGHEIGHVTERHSMEQMAKSQQANLGLTLGCILAPAVCQNQASGTLVQAVAAGTFAKFSRDDEREADAVAHDFVVRAGIDPRGIPAMFRTLLAERQRKPDALEGIFTTHPLAEDRVEDAEAKIRAMDPIVLRSLTTDTPAFQAFKQRLAALPRAGGG